MLAVVRPAYSIAVNPAEKRYGGDIIQLTRIKSDFYRDKQHPGHF